MEHAILGAKIAWLIFYTIAFIGFANNKPVEWFKFYTSCAMMITTGAVIGSFFD